MDVCHEGAKVSNELKCKALRAGRPVPVCLGEDLVYSISKKLLGGNIYFFFFFNIYLYLYLSIYSDCGSVLFCIGDVQNFYICKLGNGGIAKSSSPSP